MNFTVVIHLSKGWRSLIPRERKLTVEELAHEVGKYIAERINANPGSFPVLLSLRPEYVTAHYYPSVGAAAWEFWDKVKVEIAFEASGANWSSTDFITSLEPLLPENTHISA